MIQKSLEVDQTAQLKTKLDFFSCFKHFQEHKLKKISVVCCEAE